MKPCGNEIGVNVCMGLTVTKYTDDKELLWDRFVREESMNGTFLQTRNFINYHAPG